MLSAIRNCDVCGGADRKLIYSQRFSPITGATLMAGYEVVVCRDCGFAYADAIPDQSAFDRYYRDLSKYEHADRNGLESEEDAARFRSIALAAREFIPSMESAILEIGCAGGGLLRILKDDGYRNSVGLDPSPACVDAARQIHGIQVLNGSLFSAPELGRKFDFVILSGVLEHIRDLAHAVSIISKLLHEGGRLYVNAPDATRFTDYVEAPFQEFSVEHINFFSPVSLANLMLRNGFERISVRQAAVNLTRASTMPVVHGVFQIGLGHAPDNPERDDNTEARLLEYVCKSSRIDEGLRRVIDPLSAGARPLIVWGVGTHTQRLMATTSLSAANIVAFVDSNPKYQGKTLNGVPILAPGDLGERREPIFVSSRMFQREIVNQIRCELRLTNQIFVLYDLDGAST